MKEEYEEFMCEKFTGVVPIGLSVLWIPQANVDVQKPVPAIVIAGSPNGVCDLLILDGLVRKRTVYHMSHPSLRDHAGNVSSSGKFNGGWIFNPALVDQYEGIRGVESEAPAKPRGRGRQAAAAQSS